MPGQTEKALDFLDGKRGLSPFIPVYSFEYNAGKVIGTNVSGAPTSTIKINVRDGVIQTAFPY